MPLTGRHQLLALPESTETQMGLSAYRDILQKAKVSSDPALNEQVTRVGRRIADAAALFGSKAALQRIRAGDDPAAIAESWTAGEAKWRELREKYLLY